MADKELITTTSIRKNSFIDSNIDEQDLVNALMLAQKIDLKRLLSTELYNELLTAVPDTELAVFISDYLPNVLEWNTVSKLLDLKNIKIKASGNSKSDNESNIYIELAELRNSQSKVDGYAASFETDMLKYIDDNPEIFEGYYDDPEEYQGLDKVPTKTIFDRRLLK